MENKKEVNKELYFNLYNAQRNVSRYFTKNTLKQKELTYPQFLVLNVLWNSELVRVATIVQLLGLDTGTVSPLLKRMENKNLIRRSRSDIDQREVFIHLTDKSKQIESELDSYIYDKSAIASLDQKEIIELNRLLLKIIE